MLKRFCSLENAVRLLSLLAVLLCAYPLCVFFAVSLQKGRAAELILPMTVTCVAGGLLGFLLRAAADAAVRKLPVRLLNGIRWAFVTVPAAAAVFLLLARNSGAAVFAMALSAALYYAGSWLYVHGLSARVYAAETLIFVFPALLMAFLKQPFPVAGFVWVFLAASLLFALSLNYANIGFLMCRRGHSMARLPAKVRYHNFMLIVAFAVPVILLVLLRGHFIGAVGEIFQAFGYVLKAAFVAVVRWLLAVSDRATSGEYVGDIQAEKTDGPSVFEEMEALTANGGGNSVLQTSFTIVVVSIVAIFLLLFIWRPLARLIGEKLSRLLLFIRSRLGRFSLLRRAGQVESEYYEDVEEAVSAGGEAEPIPASHRAFRRWRRAVAEYRKQPDSRRKFLTGYQLTILGLSLFGVQIQDTDTPLEILEKSRQVLPGDAYTAATESCNALLFSGIPVPPATKALDEALQGIQQLKLPKQKN